MIVFSLPGGFDLYAFPLLLALGTLAGFGWLLTQGQQQALVPAVWALAAALIGGRLGFVAANSIYFAGHELQAFQVGLGGLSWPGALAGGLLGLAAYSAWKRQPPAALANALLPLLACLAAAAWLACWIDGVAYGPPSAWGLPAPDEWGQVAPRLPLQGLAALGSLLAPWPAQALSVALNRRLRATGGSQPPLPGWLAANSRLRYALLRALPPLPAILGTQAVILLMLFVSLYRADPSPYWGALRPETWACLPLALLALLPLVPQRRPAAATRTSPAPTPTD